MNKKPVTRVAQEARYKQLEIEFADFRKGVLESMEKYLETPAGRVAISMGNPTAQRVPSTSNNPDKPHDSSALDYITYIITTVSEGVNKTVSGTKVDFIRNAKDLLVTFDTMAVEMDICHKKFFSKYESPFNMDISIQEEVRQLVLPRAIRSVMGYIDNHYFLYKLLQDLGFKETYLRFDKLVCAFAGLEYGIFSTMKVLRNNEELSSRISIDKDVKKFILQFRGLMEAFAIDSIGKATVALKLKIQNIAVYNYCMSNDILVTQRSSVEKTINIKKISREYTEALHPIIDSISKYKKGGDGGTVSAPSSRYHDSEISFWDVSKHLTSFKDSMVIVEDEMRHGVDIDSVAMKGFEFIVQQILIPYYAHQRGAINHTFITMISQLNRHYTMVLQEIISNSLPKDYSFDEAIGLYVDLEKALEDLQATKNKRRLAMENLGGNAPVPGMVSSVKKKRFFGK